MSDSIRYVARVVVASRKNEWNEWVVRAYDQHGKRYPDADYHTDDKTDAIQISYEMTKPWFAHLSHQTTQGVAETWNHSLKSGVDLLVIYIPGASRGDEYNTDKAYDTIQDMKRTLSYLEQTLKLKGLKD